MSRSYKKHPYFLMIGDKSFKKIYNRRIRRAHLADDVNSGGSYKKLNDSWDICDCKCYYPWEEFKRTNLEFFEDEEKCYSHWKKNFGSK